MHQVDEWDYPGGKTFAFQDYVEFVPVLRPVYGAHKLQIDEWLQSDEFMHDVRGGCACEARQDGVIHHRRKLQDLTTRPLALMQMQSTAATQRRTDF